jgi:hypothetical protein
MSRGIMLGGETLSISQTKVVQSATRAISSRASTISSAGSSGSNSGSISSGATSSTSTIISDNNIRSSPIPTINGRLGHSSNSGSGAGRIIPPTSAPPSITFNRRFNGQLRGIASSANRLSGATASSPSGGPGDGGSPSGPGPGSSSSSSSSSSTELSHSQMDLESPEGKHLSNPFYNPNLPMPIKEHHHHKFPVPKHVKDRKNLDTQEKNHQPVLVKRVPHNYIEQT